MRTLVDVHAFVLGFGLIASWLVVCLWSLVLRIVNAGETPVFWRVVSIAQILLVLQLLVGLLLLIAWAVGAVGLPGAGTAGDTAWHLLYGIGFPVIVLFVAHKWARDERYDPHTIFALAGLVIFGLTARAWMVGWLGA
jgi:hypothetical protein